MARAALIYETVSTPLLPLVEGRVESLLFFLSCRSLKWQWYPNFQRKKTHYTAPLQVCQKSLFLWYHSCGVWKPGWHFLTRCAGLSGQSDLAMWFSSLGACPGSMLSSLPLWQAKTPLSCVTICYIWSAGWDRPCMVEVKVLCMWHHCDAQAFEVKWKRWEAFGCEILYCKKQEWLTEPRV